MHKLRAKWESAGSVYGKCYIPKQETVSMACLPTAALLLEPQALYG